MFGELYYFSAEAFSRDWSTLLRNAPLDAVLFFQEE